MYINWRLREIDIKIVYYGPPCSGKTTNLEQIHDRMAGRNKNKLVSLKTQEDRTLFFDFLQLETGRVRGLRPKFNLYTVPGQVIYAATRKLVLEGADGVVFVADSRADRLKENRALLGNLAIHLGRSGQDLSDYPLVLQCNKQDLPGALPPEELKGLLRQGRVPSLGSVATRGVGVFETLRVAINLVVSRL